MSAQKTRPAPAEEKTRRQTELEEAKVDADRMQGELEKAQAFLADEDATLDTLQKRRATLEEQKRQAVNLELTKDQWSADVQRIRKEIADCDAEIAHHRELREIAFARYHQEVFGQHSTALTAYHQAQVKLTQEPAEIALLEIDRLLQQLATAWTVAGHECALLYQQGNHWGNSQLTRLYHGLAHVGISEDNGRTLSRLPRFPDPEHP